MSLLILKPEIDTKKNSCEASDFAFLVDKTDIHFLINIGQNERILEIIYYKYILKYPDCQGYKYLDIPKYLGVCPRF